MTLGCGGWGGNITSDNISPRHLINIKRLAYETTPAPRRARPAAAASGASNVSPAVEAFVKSRTGLPAVARPAEPAGIPAGVLARRIDEFLGSRGYRPPQTGPSVTPAPPSPAPAAPSARPGPSAPGPSAPPAPPAPTAEPPTDFVCEEDVRLALRQSRKIVIGERTIVTPAARDLGEQHRVFVQAQWPR
jgi:acetaldehyde dehydrogenase (acetylating)